MSTPEVNLLAEKKSPVSSSTSTMPIFTAIGHGTAGANTALDLMKKMDAGKNPHVRFLILETNKRVRDNHFSPEACDANPALKSWMDSGRVNILDFGDGTGAGGVPSVGRAVLRKQLRPIKAWLKGTGTAIQIGGGGGGTASGAMPLMAETLKEMDIPLYSILTVPRIREGGRKLLKARETMKRLLRISPVAFVYNEQIKVSEDEPYSAIYGNINDTCLFPVFRVLYSLIYEVGDVQDRDATDWANFLKVGNHTLPGFYDASTDPNLDGMEAALLENRYLNNKIIAKALGLLLCFKGGWSSAHVDRVLDCIQGRMEHFQQANPDVEVKYSLKEKGVPEGEKSVGFVAFAKECETPMLEAEVSPGKPVQVSIPGTIPEEPSSSVVSIDSGRDPDHSHEAASTAAAPEGRVRQEQKTASIGGMVDGEHQTVMVTPDLANSYNSFFNRHLGSADIPAIRELQESIQAQTGLVFDFPLLEKSKVG